MNDRQTSGLKVLSPEIIGVSWYAQLFPWMTNRHLRKKASEILLGRDFEMVKTSWMKASLDFDLATRVSEIIAKWCEWPNALFLPDDTCAILFQDVDYDLTSVEAMRQIEEEIAPHMDQSVWSGLCSMSYRELINRLQRGGGNGGQTPL